MKRIVILLLSVVLGFMVVVCDFTATPKPERTLIDDMCTGYEYYIGLYKYEDGMVSEMHLSESLEMEELVNHIVSYLDRITIYSKILSDNIEIMEYLPQFTFAQICDFIKIADENKAINVQAILLEYKNKNFADFDPMDEFTLE